LLAFPSQRQTFGQEPRPMMTFTETIPYKMINSETNKDFTNKDENLKEIYDKVECLQRSQVYLHDHITAVENNIRSNLSDLKNLLLRRLVDAETYDAHMVEVN
jgi:hypothetical protein